MCLRTNSSTDIQTRIIKNSLTNHDLYTKVRAGLRGMRIDACSYSCRNISAGSSDDARMAGRMAAEAAIRKNSPAMLTKVKGSAGLVPTKMALINRVRTKPPARPMLSPISINRNPSFNTSSRIWRFLAPRAIRMPISAVRCRTADTKARHKCLFRRAILPSSRSYQCGAM